MLELFLGTKCEETADARDNAMLSKILHQQNQDGYAKIYYLSKYVKYSAWIASKIAELMDIFSRINIQVASGRSSPAPGEDTGEGPKR